MNFLWIPNSLWSWCFLGYFWWRYLCNLFVIVMCILYFNFYYHLHFLYNPLLFQKVHNGPTGVGLLYQLWPFSFTFLRTVVLCFFSFSVLMLISVIGLLSGGNMKLLVCQDLSYPFINKVIDVPGTLRGYDGNFVSTVMYNQPEDTEAKLSEMIKLVQLSYSIYSS